MYLLISFEKEYKFHDEVEGEFRSEVRMLDTSEGRVFKLLYVCIFKSSQLVEGVKFALLVRFEELPKLFKRWLVLYNVLNDW